MKRIFLLPLFALLMGSFQAKAQSCTPDDMLPDTVIVSPLPYTEMNPEQGIQDTACVAGYYETTIQVRIPATIPIAGNEVAIIDVSVNDLGISELPESFDFVCNPPECVFLPEEVGCIQIFGTATPDDVGMHDLKINVDVNAGLVLPYTLPDGQLVLGNYFFFVRPEGSMNCLVDAYEVEENAFDLEVQPNPIRDHANIYVNAPRPGEYELSVYNAQGSLVQKRMVGMIEGDNYLEFDGSLLPVGFYSFVLQNEGEAASGRFLIQR